jgi:hypothetical protein
MDNADFHLSDEQIAQYEAWAASVARPLWNADAAESLQVTISFTFNSIGRRVEARTATQTLLLEDI